MGRVPQLVAARKKDRRLGEPRDLDWRRSRRWKWTRGSS